MVQYTEWRSISDGSIISSIPDTGVIHSWPFAEGSGATTKDTTGNADGDILGDVSWVSGDWLEGFALESPGGTGDRVDCGTLGDFGSQLDGEITLAYTMQTDSTPGALWGGRNSNDDIRFIGVIGRGDADDGQIGVQFRDSNANDLRFNTTSRYDDNSKYSVVVRKTGNTGDDVEIWTGGAGENMTEDSEVTRDEDFGSGNVGDFNESWMWHDQADFDNEDPGTFGDARIATSAWTDDEIQAYHNAQPWS